MKVVIVEDEALAAEKLERYITKHNDQSTVLVVLSSIESAVSWFKNNKDFDVIFMDIQLTDGLSFEIFNKVTIDKPVIFTTAYDEFAVDAFQVNSIDYILKPVTFTNVSKAIMKLKNMHQLFNPNMVVDNIKKVEKQNSKDRFLVKLGNHIHSVKTIDIALFYAEGRTVYLMNKENKKYIIDYKLEDLNQLLNKQEFFRVNRSFIININDIKDVVVYSNSRLKIIPKIKIDKEIVVSREKVSAFKDWFAGV